MEKHRGLCQGAPSSWAVPVWVSKARRSCGRRTHLEAERSSCCLPVKGAWLQTRGGCIFISVFVSCFRFLKGFAIVKGFLKAQLLTCWNLQSLFLKSTIFPIPVNALHLRSYEVLYNAFCIYKLTAKNWTSVFFWDTKNLFERFHGSNCTFYFVRWIIINKV